MRQFKSILLLFIMGITLFPWQTICVAHPFGHDHHEHDEPSPCELRRQYKGEEPVFWPPMDCEHLFSAVDEFQQPQNDQIAPIIQMAALLAVLLDVVKFDTQRPFLLPPDPKCRSATLLSNSPLRAPPLAFLAGQAG